MKQKVSERPGRDLQFHHAEEITGQNLPEGMAQEKPQT